MNKREVMSRLRKSGVEYVRVLWCDNAGIIRAKAINSSVLTEGDNFDYPVGISLAQQAVPVMYDGVSPGSGLGPVGEVFLKPDWDTLTVLNYNQSFASVAADMYKNGSPWKCCPRDFLKRAIDELDKFGFEINAAFENEFYLLRQPEGRDVPVPVDDTLFAMASAMDSCPAVIDEITKSLKNQSMPVERYYPESGPGQYEISIRYSNALRAADNQLNYRQTVNGVALKHGMIASFMPKIFADAAGSGCHMHLSLLKHSKNISADIENDNMLSDTMAYFMAGVLRHLHALCAITVPSVNSYRRLKPHCWSGAYSCYGYDNREAAVRVIKTHDGESVSHIELKTVDASSNPYLALGSVIYAGIDGISNKLSLNDPVDVDPGTIPLNRQKSEGIRRLPETLGEALEELKNDRTLKDALGENLYKAYYAVKENEWKTMKDYGIEEERKTLLKKF